MTKRIVIVLMLILCFGLSYANTEAASDPAVVPCVAINTAKVNDTLTILVFRCEPQDGPPYLLNTAGFMMPESY